MDGLELSCGILLRVELALIGKSDIYIYIYKWMNDTRQYFF